MKLMHSRVRRRFRRATVKTHLLKRLRKAVSIHIWYAFFTVFRLFVIHCVGVVNEERKSGRFDIWLRCGMERERERGREGAVIRGLVDGNPRDWERIERREGRNASTAYPVTWATFRLQETTMMLVSMLFFHLWALNLWQCAVQEWGGGERKQCASTCRRHQQ